MSGMQLFSAVRRVGVTVTVTGTGTGTGTVGRGRGYGAGGRGGGHGGGHHATRVPGVAPSRLSSCFRDRRHLATLVRSRPPPSTPLAASSISTVLRPQRLLSSDSAAVATMSSSSEDAPSAVEDHPSDAVRHRAGSRFPSYDTLDGFVKSLEISVRRTSRVSPGNMNKVMILLEKGNCSPDAALGIIRNCGSVMVDAAKDERTRLVLQSWDLLEKFGVPLDASHYNMLLKTHLENEHSFSPTEFLSWMESKGVVPNRATFGHLVARFCSEGDLSGATAILEHMREQDMALNHSVFHSLIRGHCKAGDVQSATGVIKVMSESGLDVHSGTHVTLLVGMIEAGKPWNEVEVALKEVLAREDVSLGDGDILSIALELVRRKESAAAKEVIGFLPKKNGYFQYARNMIPQIIYEGEVDLAKELYDDICLRKDVEGRTDFGAFFFRPLVSLEHPPEKMIDLMKQFTEHNDQIALRVLELCIRLDKPDYGKTLFKLTKEELGEAAVHHGRLDYFLYGQVDGMTRVDDVINLLFNTNQIGWQPNVDTLERVVIQNLLALESSEGYSVVPLLSRLRARVHQCEAGTSWMYITNAAIRYLLNSRKQEHFDQALDCATKAYPASLVAAFWTQSLARSYLATGDLDALMAFVFMGASRNWKQSHVFRVLPQLHGFAASEDKGVEEKSAEEVLVRVLDALKSNNIGVPPDVCQTLSSILEDQGARDLLQSLEKMNSEVEEIWTTQAVKEKMNSIIKMSTKRVARGNVKNTESLKMNARGLKKFEDRLLSSQHFLINGLSELTNEYLERGETELALELIHTMLDKHNKTGYLSVHEVVKSLLKEDKAEKVQELVKRLVECDISIFTTTIAAICQHMIRKDLYEDMKKFLSVVPPSLLLSNKEFWKKRALLDITVCIAETKDVEKTKELIDFMIERQFLSAKDGLTFDAMIIVQLENNDLEGAVAAFEDVFKVHDRLASLKRLMKALIVAEDAEKMQRVLDTAIIKYGEEASLYDLLENFLLLGRFQQARKLLDTPGLRFRDRKVKQICDELIRKNLLEALENFTLFSRNVFDCDRIYMYRRLIEANSSDGDKLLDIWVMMQEEGVTPTEEIKKQLAKTLEKAGKEVPF